MLASLLQTWDRVDAPVSVILRGPAYTADRPSVFSPERSPSTPSNMRNPQDCVTQEGWDITRVRRPGI